MKRVKEEHSRPTQAVRVMEYMERYGSITQLQALTDIGVMHLAARIYELKNKDGKNIKSNFVGVRNRWGELTYIKRYYIVHDGEENAEVQRV